MVTSLDHSSSVGVTHFVIHSVAATSASVQSASSLTAATTALGSSAFAGAKLTKKVIDKNKELGLDENGRSIAQRGAGRSSGRCSEAAEKAATQLARVVEAMLDEQYASLEKADPQRRPKAKATQISLCRACKADMCHDFNLQGNLRVAQCSCGHRAQDHAQDLT